MHARIAPQAVVVTAPQSIRIMLVFALQAKANIELATDASSPRHDAALLSTKHTHTLLSPGLVVPSVATLRTSS